MKRPTLVCLNNGAAPARLTRYVPKPTGGFYTETFEVVDPEQMHKSLTVETMEGVRLGRMRDQVADEELQLA